MRDDESIDVFPLTLTHVSACSMFSLCVASLIRQDAGHHWLGSSLSLPSTGVEMLSIEIFFANDINVGMKVMRQTGLLLISITKFVISDVTNAIFPQDKRKQTIPVVEVYPIKGFDSLHI